MLSEKMKEHSSDGQIYFLPKSCRQGAEECIVSPMSFSSHLLVIQEDDIPSLPQDDNTPLVTTGVRQYTELVTILLNFAVEL